MRVGTLASGRRGQRPATLDEIVEEADRAERLGLASMWFSNIFGHDAMTAAALAARVTTRIEVGTAVTPTYPRHPYAMAQQAASTQAAARARFTLGVGPSHRVVVGGMWGLSYRRTFRTYASLPSYRAMLDKEGVADPADVAVIGDEDALGEQLMRFAELGATDFIASPFSSGQEGAGLDECLGALARAIPKLAAAPAGGGAIGQ